MGSARTGPYLASSFQTISCASATRSGDVVDILLLERCVDGAVEAETLEPARGGVVALLRLRNEPDLVHLPEGIGDPLRRGLGQPAIGQGLRDLRAAEALLDAAEDDARPGVVAEGVLDPFADGLAVAHRGHPVEGVDVRLDPLDARLEVLVGHVAAALPARFLEALGGGAS